MLVARVGRNPTAEDAVEFGHVLLPQQLDEIQVVTGDL